MSKRLHTLARLLAFAAGIYLIMVAITTLSRGAAVAKDVLALLGVGGVESAVGLGWIGAIALMSGSPSASIALTLLDQGALDRFEAMGMIAGSRLGSAFVILFVGFLHDTRARQQGRTSYIGAAAFFISLTLCVPALLLGVRLIAIEPLMASLCFRGGGDVRSVVDVLLGPAQAMIGLIRWPPVLFFLGIGLLLLAFKVLDHALPDVSRAADRIAPVGAVLYRPDVMFLIGMAVTVLTLSVSVSITVLVPLTAKGYVRRENLFPYIMGANITTFVDTLFVSCIVEHADAFPVVMVFMACVAAVALPLILVGFARYQRAVDRLSFACVRDRVRLLGFVAFLCAAPVVLLLL